MARHGRVVCHHQRDSRFSHLRLRTGAVVAHREALRVRIHGAHRERRNASRAVAVAALGDHRREGQSRRSARSWCRRKATHAQARRTLRIHERLCARDAARHDARDVSNASAQRRTVRCGDRPIRLVDAVQFELIKPAAALRLFPRLALRLRLGRVFPERT